MAVQPNFPTVDTNAYRCAACFVVQNSHSYNPFQSCVNECSNVSLETRQCIQNETAKNVLVLPHNMSCVKSTLVQSDTPKSQSQTLDLANYNQCLNNCN